MDGSLMNTIGVIVLTYFGWRVASRIYFVRRYWKQCRAETLSDAHGVKSSSWLEKGTASASWFRINDAIMGGKSTSELSTDGKGRLVFSGSIHTDGGGFASVRTTEECVVAVPKTARKVRLVVEGDGHLWKVNLGLGHSLMDSSPTYSHDVLTQAGRVTTHELPLDAFSAQRRGRTVAGADLEDPSKIRYVGLILSRYTQDGTPNPHFGDGPFRIALHELEFV